MHEGIIPWHYRLLEHSWNVSGVDCNNGLLSLGLDGGLHVCSLWLLGHVGNGQLHTSAVPPLPAFPGATHDSLIIR